MIVVSKARWGFAATVLGIVGAASFGVVLLLKGRIVDTKEMNARARLKTLHEILDVYKARHGVYPTTEQSLTVLIPEPGSRGYLTGPQALLDPWGAQYVYRSPDVRRGGGAFQLYSRGPNGVDEGGGGDDIAEP